MLQQVWFILNLAKFALKQQWHGEFQGAVPGSGPEGACGQQVDAQQAPVSTGWAVNLASFALRQEKQLENVGAQSWHGERLLYPVVIPSEIQVKQGLWFHRLSCDAGTVNPEHYGLFQIVTKDTL